MGYRLNRLDEPVFMAGPKSMRTEFGIHPKLESCVELFHSVFALEYQQDSQQKCKSAVKATNILKDISI